MRECVMKQNNKHIVILWVIFALFAFVYITKMMSLWPVLSAWSLMLAIYLLIKNKLPSKNRVLLSVLLAVLVSVSYIGLSSGFSFSMLITAITCLFACLAVFSVMDKCEDYKLINKDTKWAPLVSILIGIGAGIILSIINTFLDGNNTMDIKLSFWRLLPVLSPAIHEEITYRAIFMAFCVYALKDQKATKFQRFTMWFMMTVPHTLSHGYGLVESAVLCILFGIPFAILQRKRDITSAMVCHGFVDAIRFVLFGLGI